MKINNEARFCYLENQMDAQLGTLDSQIARLRNMYDLMDKGAEFQGYPKVMQMIKDMARTIDDYEKASKKIEKLGKF